MSVVPVLSGEQFNAKHTRGGHGRFAPGLSRPKLLKRDERVVASAAETFRPRPIPTPGHAAEFTRGQPVRIHPDTVKAFHELAGHLRRGDASDHRVADVDAAMGPIAHDLVLTRHMPASAFGLKDDELGHLPELLAGRKVADRAFAPVALHQPDQRGGVTMHIAAPAGTRAMVAGDNELWLDRDTELAVTGVHPNGQGGWTVEVTALPKGTPAAKKTTAPAKKAAPVKKAAPAPPEPKPEPVAAKATPAKKATARKAAAAKPKPLSPEETVAKLRTVESRADAHELIRQYQKKDLTAALDHAGVRYGKSDTKQKLQDALVESTAGRRLDSEAKTASPSREVEPEAHGGYIGPTWTMPANADPKDVARLRQLIEGSPEVATRGAAAMKIEMDSEAKQLARKLGKPLAIRLAWESDAQAGIGRFVLFSRPPDPNLKPTDMLPPVTDAERAAAQATAEGTLRTEWSGRKVAARVTDSSLAGILNEGRFKTQFETGRSGGGYRPDLRANAENAMFGIPKNADPKTRPIYGYLAMEGVGAPHDDDLLNTYGDVQVVFKDTVRSRTTASVGDTLDQSILPSPVDDPKWYSFNAGSHRYSTNLDYGQNRSILYVEAQIHGGVGVDDIEEVVFPREPSQAVRNQLQNRGVSWRIAAQ